MYNVTRFTEILLSLVDGLETKNINNKIMVYFNTTLDNLIHDHIMDPSCYLKSLRDTVNCTRKSMEKIENNFEFSSNCQESSVPIEWLSLISTLIDGENIDNEIFRQTVRTSAQQITFSYRIKKEKKVNNTRRYLKIKETPVQFTLR